MSTVIGVGIDVCDVDRMRRVLARSPRFAARVFTEDEQAYCRKRRDPVERFAARFAAKEAVLKAMGVGLGACAFREIEVVRAESGAPSLALRGAAGELAAARGIANWHVSLSHTSTVAEALVIAVGG